jgi:uncharacterized membrane protein
VKDYRLLSFVVLLGLLTLCSLTLFAQIAAANPARIEYYDINLDVDDTGKTHTKLSMTFEEPEAEFDFTIIGRVESFEATTIAGPENIDCQLEERGITYIVCKMNLTQSKRSIEINFDTADFVKSLGEKDFFNADFTTSKEVKQVFASVRLSEVMKLVSENVTENRISFPDNVTIETGGRTIIASWRLINIQPNQPLRFQFLYEQVQATPIFSIRLQYFLYLGIAAAAIIVFVIYWYKRKPQKMVLSVLDDYERSVMDIIVANNGSVNQKKVVQETNLSKAKVSRVVKSLVERGLIEIEHRGRTNILKVQKNKFKV